MKTNWTISNSGGYTYQVTLRDSKKKTPLNRAKRKPKLTFVEAICQYVLGLKKS